MLRRGRRAMTQHGSRDSPRQAALRGRVAHRIHIQVFGTEPCTVTFAILRIHVPVAVRQAQGVTVGIRHDHSALHQQRRLRARPSHESGRMLRR